MLDDQRCIAIAKPNIVFSETVEMELLKKYKLYDEQKLNKLGREFKIDVMEAVNKHPVVHS